MSRKQNSLVPIGEVISGPSGPVKAIRDDSPQPGLCKRSGFEWIGDQKKCRSSLI